MMSVRFKTLISRLYPATGLSYQVSEREQIAGHVSCIYMCNFYSLWPFVGGGERGFITAADR